MEAWAAISVQLRSPGDGSHYQEGFRRGRDRFGQRSVRRLVRQILFTGEEADEGAALFGDVVAYGAGQHGIACLECVEDGPLSDGTLEFELHFAVDLGQCAEMRRKLDADHGRVCTSTERIAGRSCTMEDKRSHPSG